MVNKKGYIKTIEAVVAIVAILIFIFTALPRSDQAIIKKPTMIESNLENIMDEVIIQKIYRAEVIASNGECGEEDVCTNFLKLKELVENNLVVGYTYKFSICPDPSCVADLPSEKDVYMDDLFIASSRTTQEPKVFRVWMWRK